MKREFYRRYSELQQEHWWFRGRRRIIDRVLGRLAPRRAAELHLLDFGCGTGAMLDVLARHGEVCGVDRDPEAVELARRRGIGSIERTAADGELPFDDSSFDVATALDVLEHLEDELPALGELHRVLAPGGLLIVTVPAFELLWGVQDEVSHHFRRYTEPGLVSLLESGGFSVRRSSYFNTLLFGPIAALRLARRLRRPPPLAGGEERTDFELGPRWLNRPLGRLLGAEAELVVRGGLPFGVSLLAIAHRR